MMVQFRPFTHCKQINNLALPLNIKVVVGWAAEISNSQYLKLNKDGAPAPEFTYMHMHAYL